MTSVNKPLTENDVYFGTKITRLTDWHAPEVYKKKDVVSAVRLLKEKINASDSACTLYAFSDEMIDLIDECFPVAKDKKGGGKSMKTKYREFVFKIRTSKQDIHLDYKIPKHFNIYEIGIVFLLLDRVKSRIMDDIISRGKKV